MTAARKRSPKPAAQPAAWRPPGWYTEPVRAWFGAHWQPATNWGQDLVAASARAAAGRAVRVAAGDSGSIVGLSKRSDALLAAATIARAKAARG